MPRLDTYRITKQKIVNALSLTDIQAWGWEGNGPEGFLVITHSTSILPSTPLPNFDTIRQHWDQYSFLDLKAQFLSSIPLEKFRYLSVSFDSTYVHFSLNEPEE